MSKNTILLLIFILWANVQEMNAEELFKEISASLMQRKYLAKSVCTNLIVNTEYPSINKQVREDRELCENNFLSLNHISEEPPKVTINERTKYKVSFTLTPSKHVQIVALVNEHDSDEKIYYSLVKNNERPNAIYPDPAENYTFWSAALSRIGNGFPSLWRRGPSLQPWKHIQNVEKQYDIQFNFSMDSYKKDSFYIGGQFWWNTSDSDDTYFEVINNCIKDTQGNMYHRRIGPGSNRTVKLLSLPLNDTCTIRVMGKYGMTNLTYHTPAYENMPLFAPIPEIPENVSTEISQEVNSDLWSVLVRWGKPRRAPRHYNVTLRVHSAKVPSALSLTVPGNATEAKFKNVKGEGLFIVSVVARLGKYGAVANQRNLFPVRQTAPESSDLMMGASWAAALLTVSALLMFILYVRRRLASRRCSKIYFPGVLEKISDDVDKDAGALVSGSEDQWEIRPERLLLHEIIGEGAFGVVRRGTLAPASKNVAVKMLKDFPSLEEIRSFRAEMELMKSVGAHPHVVSLVGCCSGRRPLIVAEYCSRGDLLTFLRCSWDLMLSRRNAKYYNNNKEVSNYRIDLFKNKPDSRFVANRLYELEGICDTELTLLDLLSFCRQIAMGMEFLASNRVVHRDLAARNILVTADKTLKIADFGLSRDVYQENQYKQKSNGKMPVKWMALESLTHRIYTTQTDVWSFGVVMWEVVSVGGAPYAGVSAARLPRLLAAGYRMPRPQNCSASLYQLMLACWSARPRSRPTFCELHAALDEMLCASADHYLSLMQPASVPDDVTTDAPLSRYVRNLMRGKWRNGKMYERPLTNHYTAQPSTLIQT